MGVVGMGGSLVLLLELLEFRPRWAKRKLGLEGFEFVLQLERWAGRMGEGEGKGQGQHSVPLARYAPRRGSDVLYSRYNQAASP